MESSADLQVGTFIPIDGVTASTNEMGEGTAIVPAEDVGSGRNFLRIAE